MSTLSQVIEERDAARAEAAYLRQALKDVTDGEFQCPGEPERLSRSLRRMLCVLKRANGGILRIDAMMEALYFDRHPGEVPGREILKAWANRLRNKLISHRLQTHWGIGYSLHEIARKDS